MSEESQNNNMDNEGGNSDHDCTVPKSTETIAIVNAVLAYIHYGISSATPDNVMEVVLGHFTGEEILNAKNMMWRECELGDPPPRNNSRARKASEAHLHDILKEIYKIDTNCYAFMVESDGIARLPRFNAECLNVVSIDTRIAELKEECFALKIESSSYRHDYLMCMDELDAMKTVLQQHTNALRDLTGPTSTSYINRLETKHESAQTVIDDPLCPNDMTSQSSPASASSSCIISDTSNQSMTPSPPSKLTTPVALQSQLSVTSLVQQPPPLSSVSTVMTSSTDTVSVMSGSCNPVISTGDCLRDSKAIATKYNFSQPLFMHQPIPSIFMPPFPSTNGPYNGASHPPDPSVSSQLNGKPPNQQGKTHRDQHGLSYGAAPPSLHAHTHSGAFSDQQGSLCGSAPSNQCSNQHDPHHSGVHVPPMQFLSRGHPRRRRRVIRQITEHNQGEFCLFDRETCGNDGFERTKHDIKKENRREIQRRNVIHGTRKNTRSIPAGEGKNMSNCDLFVHHLQRKTTVAGMKSFLSENNINVRHVRLDIVSHQMATYKSFRLIAPGHYRSQLMSPEFWPINVRVSEFEPQTYMKTNAQNDMSRNNLPTENYYNNG